MNVYVDELKVYGEWRYGKSCHLFPANDGRTALGHFHNFAESIGLRRDWFQNGRWPHYDLTASKRKIAVKLGAIELTTRLYIRWQWALTGAEAFAPALEEMKILHATHRLKDGIAKGTVSLE